TPPCADLIIHKKIKTVVIGCLDPNEKVSGKGIERLRQAGCNVITGVLEKASRELNKRFIYFHEKKRHYIILKWAATTDGFIAGKEQQIGQPLSITHLLSKQRVHQWRTEEQAILVGTQTALQDNPRLTTRWVSGNNPLRVVIDRKLKIPEHYHLFNAEAIT